MTKLEKVKQYLFDHVSTAEIMNIIDEYIEIEEWLNAEIPAFINNVAKEHTLVDFYNGQVLDINEYNNSLFVDSSQFFDELKYDDKVEYAISKKRDWHTIVVCNSFVEAKHLIEGKEHLYSVRRVLK